MGKLVLRLVHSSYSWSGDLLADLTVREPKEVHALHDVNVLLHLAQCHMLAVQPLHHSSADEELGAIDIGPALSMDRPHMLQNEILIIELLLVDGLATCVTVTVKSPR